MNLTKESIIGQIFEQFRDVFVADEGKTAMVYVIVKTPDRKVAECVLACRERLCDMLPNLHSVVQLIDCKDERPDDIATKLDAVRVTYGHRWAGDEHDKGAYVDLDCFD